MPVLHVLRHAKSGRDDPSLEDHERTLNARGRSDATVMGAHLAAENVCPDLVVCSTALRTRQTLELIRPHLPESVQVRYERELYLAEAEDILAVLAKLGGAAKEILLVGHNPGLQDLLLDLVGSGPRKDLRQIEEKLPTCALASVELPGAAWADIEEGSGRLVRLATPARLAAARGRT